MPTLRWPGDACLLSVFRLWRRTGRIRIVLVKLTIGLIADVDKSQFFIVQQSAISVDSGVSVVIRHGKMAVDELDIIDVFRDFGSPALVPRHAAPKSLVEKALAATGLPAGANMAMFYSGSLAKRTKRGTGATHPGLSVFPDRTLKCKGHHRMRLGEVH